MNEPTLQDSRPGAQFQIFCAATHRPPRELARLLIRTAQQQNHQAVEPVPGTVTSSSSPI